MSKCIRLLPLILLLVTLAACGGDDNGDDGTATVNLPETFTGPLGDGQLTIHHPEGWVHSGQLIVPGVAAFPLFSMASRQPLLDAAPNDIPDHLQPGDVSLVLLAGTMEDDSITPQMILTEYLADLTSTEDVTFDIGDVEAYQVDGRDAAITHGKATTGGRDVGVIMTAIDIGAISAWLTFTVPLDEVDDRVPLARAITAQMEYTPDEE